MKLFYWIPLWLSFTPLLTIGMEAKKNPISWYSRYITAAHEARTMIASAIQKYFESQDIYKIYQIIQTLQQDLASLEQKSTKDMKDNIQRQLDSIIKKIQDKQPLSNDEKNILAAQCSSPNKKTLSYQGQIDNLITFFNANLSTLQDKKILIKIFYLMHLFAQFIKNLETLSSLVPYIATDKTTQNLVTQLNIKIIKCFERINNATHTMIDPKELHDIEAIITTQLTQQTPKEIVLPTKAAISISQQTIPRWVTLIKQFHGWAGATTTIAVNLKNKWPQLEDKTKTLLYNMNTLFNGIHITFDTIELKWHTFDSEYQISYKKSIYDVLQQGTPYSAILLMNKGIISILQLLHQLTPHISLFIHYLADISYLIGDFTAYINSELVEDPSLLIFNIINNNAKKIIAISNSLYDFAQRIAPLNTFSETSIEEKEQDEKEQD